MNTNEMNFSEKELDTAAQTFPTDRKIQLPYLIGGAVVCLLIGAGSVLVYQRLTSSVVTSPKEEIPIKVETQTPLQQAEGISPTEKPELGQLLAETPPTDTVVFTDKKSNFSFKYKSENFSVVETNEAETAKENNVNFPQDFTKAFGYPPEKLVSAYKVVPRKVSATGGANTELFSVWQFENSMKLGVGDWYKKYMYYPLAFGTSEDPVKQTSVQVGQSQGISSEVECGPGGCFQYYLIPVGSKMFVFDIPDPTNIDRQSPLNEILSSFNFNVK